MLQSPTINGCPIGNWGCPCLPVAHKQMTCAKVAFKQLEKTRNIQS
jgi:hypothetical protein